MKVLLVAPTFFGYYRDVISELCHLGWEVSFVPDRPSESVAYKTLAKIEAKLIDSYLERYVRKIERKFKQNYYDLVIFMGGMTIAFKPEHYSSFRKYCKGKFVLALWDSLENSGRLQKSIEQFDVVLSFEKPDCEQYGAIFSPLFYANEYKAVPLKPVNGFEYDACFIGSVHQVSKFLTVKRMVNRLEEAGAKVFYHYYLPSKSIVSLRRVQHRAYRSVRLSTHSLSRETIVDIVTRSRTVIDSPQAGQQGLTIRSIEAVGAQRRLLTSNSSAVDYDFYQSGNTYVYRDEGPLNLSWVKQDPMPLPSPVREYYSVRNWVCRILDVAKI